jgi:serine/threonine protein kinase
MFHLYMFRNLDIDFRVFSITDIEIDSKNKLSAGSYGETFVGTMKDKLGNSVSCVVKSYKSYVPTDVMDEDIIKEIIFLRLLNQFNVRSVVKLFGILLHENKFYLVLEKLDATLQDFRLKDKTHVDPPQVKHIFHDLLDAINSMHELGILHNDLKLANIMLKGQDVKLIDFGLSKFIGIAPPYKQVVGSYRTTPVIMAPDQQRISYATDVFSIGRTMFHFYLKQYDLINTNSAGTSLCDEKRCYMKTEVDAYFGSNGYELLINMLNKNVEKRYCAITALNHAYFKPSNGGGFEMTLLSQGLSGRMDNIKNKNLEYCYFENIYENYKNDPLTLKTIENDGYKKMINELLRLYSHERFNFDSFDALVNGIILTNQHFETYISEKYNKCDDYLIFNVILYQVITSNYSNKMDMSYLKPNFNVNLIEILKFDINFYPVSSQIMFIYLNLITNTSTTDEETKMLRASHDFIETSLFNILFWFIQSNILSHVKINDIVIFSAIKVLKNMKIDWTKYSFLTMDDLIYQRMNNYMIDTISQIDVSNYDQYAFIYAYEHLKFPIDELKSKVSLKKLVEMRYSIQLLIDKGFTITDLFSSGIGLKQIPKNILLTTNFDILKKYKKIDFWKVDISPLELNKMGASINDLIEAGYDDIVYFTSMIDKSLDDSDPEKPLKLKDLKQLSSSIFSLKHLASIFSLPKLVQYYDLEQLHDKFKASDLILSHLFDITDLKKYFQLNYFVKYFNPKQLHGAGFDLKEIYLYFSLSTLLSHFSLQDLRDEADVGPFIDLPISQLKEAFSLQELVDAKKPLSKLIENYKISELKQYFELENFLNNGVKISDLKDEYKLTDFVDQSIQPKALLSAGFKVEELKDFFKPIKLLNAGVSLSILKDIYPLSDLRINGISATNLQLAGVAYDELKKIYQLDDLIKENVPLKELIHDYKFSMLELKLAGIQLNQLQALGVPLTDLKSVFDLHQLLEKFPLSDFKDVFTIPELKNAVIKPDALLSATFELEKIYQFYTLAELIDAKIALSNIKLLGVKASELKNLGKGISVNDLVDAGYTLDDLTAANFSARELFLANIKLSDIFKTGAFKYSDIKESYRQKPDPELEMLLKQCTKNLLRKTNPDCRFDPKSNKVLNTPITSKKGGRRQQTKKSRRANPKK